MLEFVFSDEVVIEECSPDVNGRSFAIDISSVLVFFKVVDPSGEGDSFLSLFSGLCSDVIDK